MSDDYLDLHPVDGRPMTSNPVDLSNPRLVGWDDCSSDWRAAFIAVEKAGGVAEWWDHSSETWEGGAIDVIDRHEDAYRINPHIVRVTNHPSPALIEVMRGAVARGWTHPANAHKEMDVDLAEAITKEVVALFSSPGPVT